MQLKPQVESFDLIERYNFNISMMERLILGDMPYAQLKYQNRMHKTISPFLKDIYPKLQDGPNVANIKRIPFFEKSLIFWTHEFPEYADRSYTNLEEANRCAALSNFLVGQGIRP